MTQLITKIINLQDLFLKAKYETVNMIEQEMDISDPSLVTPLEVLANDYQEIAQLCNQTLIDLIQQQQSVLNEEPMTDFINEF